MSDVYQIALRAPSTNHLQQEEATCAFFNILRKSSNMQKFAQLLAKHMAICGNTVDQHCFKAAFRYNIQGRQNTSLTGKLAIPSYNDTETTAFRPALSKTETTVVVENMKTKWPSVVFCEMNIALKASTREYHHTSERQGIHPQAINPPYWQKKKREDGPFTYEEMATRFSSFRPSPLVEAVNDLMIPSVNLFVDGAVFAATRDDSNAIGTKIHLLIKALAKAVLNLAIVALRGMARIDELTHQLRSGLPGRDSVLVSDVIFKSTRIGCNALLMVAGAKTAEPGELRFIIPNSQTGFLRPVATVNRFDGWCQLDFLQNRQEIFSRSSGLAFISHCRASARADAMSGPKPRKPPEYLLGSGYGICSTMPRSRQRQSDVSTFYSKPRPDWTPQDHRQATCGLSGWIIAEGAGQEKAALNQALAAFWGMARIGELNHISAIGDPTPNSVLSSDVMIKETTIGCEALLILCGVKTAPTGELQVIPLNSQAGALCPVEAVKRRLAVCGPRNTSLFWLQCARRSAPPDEQDLCRDRPTNSPGRRPPRAVGLLLQGQRCVAQSCLRNPSSGHLRLEEAAPKLLQALSPALSRQRRGRRKRNPQPGSSQRDGHANPRMLRTRRGPHIRVRASDDGKRRDGIVNMYNCAG
ncbi:hypothetical protein VP01_790g1 [Puccinia sorghi]|uniref:Uncharacterized protein n=1 Tax=Puccinia sorghi TaxID=27349 RepID=A0A0L6UAV5_9BASI|nr:hypothetical protein VP01_790g1 [Puccinia sorghi]